MTQTLTHGNMNWTMNMQHMNIYYSRCLYCFPTRVSAPPIAFKNRSNTIDDDKYSTKTSGISMWMLRCICGSLLFHTLFVYSFNYCAGPSATRILHMYTRIAHFVRVIRRFFFLDILFESCVDGCYQCGFQWEFNVWAWASWENKIHQHKHINISILSTDHIIYAIALYFASVIRVKNCSIQGTLVAGRCVITAFGRKSLYKLQQITDFLVSVRTNLSFSNLTQLSLMFESFSNQHWPSLVRAFSVFNNKMHQMNSSID